jgi:hypothetical protein
MGQRRSLKKSALPIPARRALPNAFKNRTLNANSHQRSAGVFENMLNTDG